MDIIFLHDLKVDTVIGIWEWERQIRQTVVIDLDMAADIRKAAASDDVRRYVELQAGRQARPAVHQPRQSFSSSRRSQSG